MLRPASPLTVVLLIAFILLLISVLTAPVIKGLTLSSHKGTDYGVFGYCEGSACSDFRIGYPSDVTSEDKDFSLPESARHSLSPLLVFHPIAALFTLIILGLAIAAHFHSPSHSPRFLLALLILVLPAFLLSLLAFLIDILIFIPHPGIGVWLVLVATLLLGCAGIISCAMRRTLVSRKARKRRIADNAEMNGQNFYSQQAPPPPPLAPANQPSAPLVNGAPGADRLPAFATFEKSEVGIGHDEHIPLHSRTPSNGTRTNDSFTQGVGMAVGDDGSYGSPGSGMSPISNRSYGSGRGRGFAGGRDEYGNPLRPSIAFGPAVRSRLENNNSAPPLPGGPNVARGGFQGYGRGGYGRGGPPGGWRSPSPQGGDFDPRGPPPDPAGMAYGNPRGPPPVYPNGAAGRPDGYSREPSPYGNRRASPGPRSSSGSGRRPSPSPFANTGGFVGLAINRPPMVGGTGPSRADGPPAPAPLQIPDGGYFVGQAVEMDATTGSPSPSHQNSPTYPTAPYNQPQGLDPNPRGMNGSRRQQLSPTSVYSVASAYIPPRSGWNGQRRSVTPPLPMNTIPEPSPVELPSAVDTISPQQRAITHGRVGSGDNYYEDVPPRFVQNEPPMPMATELPTTTMPGNAVSYDDPHEGLRSPAESDASHYTSVSQRGINPKWTPGLPSGPAAGLAARRAPPPQQASRDVLLSGNQDFALPRRGPPAPGRLPGQIPALMPSAGGGRYPGPNQF